LQRDLLPQRIEPMTIEPNRLKLLPAGGIQGLLEQKEDIRQMAVGQVPERLVQGVSQAVLRLSRKEPAERVLAPRILQLVRQTLCGLAKSPWKSDTALVLRLASRVS
jgi:hypothetical protein